MDLWEYVGRTSILASATVAMYVILKRDITDDNGDVGKQ